MEGILGEMGIFSRKKKETVQDEPEQIDEGRRRFLTKTVPKTAGAVAGLTLLPKIGLGYVIKQNDGVGRNYLLAANKEESHMMETTSLGKELMGVRGRNARIRKAMHEMTAIKFYEKVFDVNINGYPPGITNSKYSSILKEMWDVRKDREELHKYLGVHSIKKGESSLLTNSEIFREEPAVYLLASFMYDNCDKYATDVIGLDSKNDEAMIHFAKGISKYTSAYIFGLERFRETKGIMDLQNDIEIPFLNSIFTAAGYKNGLNNYFRKDKKEVVDETMDLLRHQNDKNQLIASWSNFWLRNYYVNLGWLKNSKNKPYGKIGWKNFATIENNLITMRTDENKYYYDNKGGIKI